MNNQQNTQGTPTVLLFCDPGGLGVSLVDQLLSSMCNVCIVSDAVAGWSKKLVNISTKDNLKVYSLQNYLESGSPPNYILYVSCSVEGQAYIESVISNEEKHIEAAALLSSKYQANTLYVFPYLIYPDINIDILQYAERLTERTSDLSGLIFLGDIIGPNMNISDARVLPRALYNIANRENVVLPSRDFQIFPTRIIDATSHIIRTLFSFGGVGEKIALVSDALSLRDVHTAFAKAKSDLIVDYRDESHNYPVFKNLTRIEKLKIDFDSALKEAVEWYLPNVGSNIIETKAPIESIEFRQIVPEDPPLSVTKELSKVFKKATSKLNIKLPRRRIKSTKRHYAIFFTVLLLFLAPFMSLLLGGMSMLVVKNGFKNYNLSRVGFGNSLAERFFSFSNGVLVLYTRAPLLGNMFLGVKHVSQVGLKTTDLVDRGIAVYELGNGLSKKILTGKGKDISDYSRELALESEIVYRDLSFLESDLGQERGTAGYFLNKFYGDFPLSEIRSKLSNGLKLIERLPDVLGESTPKNYLVLFKNNMELRPGGGFIGSFATVAFDNGSLSGFEVYDVYDADGQLKGYVEPPEPIKTHLGEASWYLRDSNWDPDFSVSAQRAEWFLDKELDISVDGVVSVDLEFARSLVSMFGSVQLTDFSKTLTSDNLYEITQEEVEKDFFPGSRKKSNFLTSLARELLAKLSSVEEDSNVQALSSIYDNLETRHVQMFFHDIPVQNSISKLGWSGTIDSKECEGNCFSDYLSVIDANVGVNKANYYISRDMSLNLSIDGTSINRSLAVNIKNSAPKSLGDKGLYKNYIRAFVPQLSQFSTVEIIQNGVAINVDPDVADIRGETYAGVLVEIPASSEATMVFRWKSDVALNYAQAGHYNLYWRKQAGTSSTPISVNIDSSVNALFNNILTHGATNSYNTNLDRDFVTRLDW